MAKGRVGVDVERLRNALVPLIRAHYPDGAARLPDLDQLVSAATEATSLSTFLAELALDPPSSSADYAGPPQLEEDYLILSTVHSAKGLEWDAVHVINASDGNFPSDMALSTPEGSKKNGACSTSPSPAPARTSPSTSLCTTTTGPTHATTRTATANNHAS